ncbi:biotin carboxyl carrier protein [Prauserella muralis]|uniref:Biotin carboxyl carrier protein n=1 Tax=Prauserella muralis TaxID=588067 RepID=A0A2V4B1E7_9PSEU|nr:biotin carboxyl carrier protein [Prauserella muralis]PXY27812.1 biotin carboxyl carrier protein [Prauserella muralis]TWE22428.1 oxaloacetate decarboxylase alpha subunit [Prauserella muralis]
MAEVGLVDVSLRDGNQSLWGAAGLRTGHVLQLAPLLERVGFRALDYSSSTAMGMLVRVHRENPWDLIRRTRAVMPTTKLQFIGTGFRFISWQNSHPDTMQLVYDRLVACGIDRVVVLDPMHDMEAVRATARRLKKAGVDEVVGALTFTISAVHDDAFYADLARQLRECPDVDRAYVKDPAGILTAERARTLLPAVRKQLGDTPLELHSHATIGLSALTYSIAPELGVEVVQTACGALGNGSSLPEARRTVANLREMGHRVDIDDRALGLACDFVTRLAGAEELPAGQPQEFDAAFLHHQTAGGVLTTTRRQLREIGMEDRFGALIEEVGRVRAELGHPIMVTPFPQMVVSQALFNVIGQRYSNVPDQVIRYALGSFGRPTAPIDADVLDRILDRPRARELRAEPPPPSPAELRRRFGPAISDEELLLRAHMPAEQVDAMIAAGPPSRHYNPAVTPVLALLDGLGQRRTIHDLTVDKPGLRLTVRRHAEGTTRA